MILSLHFIRCSSPHTSVCSLSSVAQLRLITYLPASDPEEFDPAQLPPSVLSAVEADSFWCLTRLLDGIQDNYIFAQPGIQRSVKRMAELVARIDGKPEISGISQLLCLL